MIMHVVWMHPCLFKPDVLTIIDVGCEIRGLRQATWHTLQVSELRDLCKQEHVKGYSKLKKDELVSILQKQLRS